jgi:hypothetical protein
MTYIDRPRPEYEPLFIIKFFRGSHDFRFKKNYAVQEKPLPKNNFLK